VPGFKAGTTHLEAKITRGFEAITGLPPSSRTLNFALDAIRDGHATEAEVLAVLEAMAKCFKGQAVSTDLASIWWAKNWERTKARWLRSTKPKPSTVPDTHKPSPEERAKIDSMLAAKDEEMRRG